MKKKELICKYYRDVSVEHGLSASYSMSDLIIRQKELNVIIHFLTKFGLEKIKVLEIGCGNGYCLEKLSILFPHIYFEGLDVCQEAIDIAKKRMINNISFKLLDILDMTYEDDVYDIVISTRCLINILDSSEQRKAIRNIRRVIAEGGYFLLIECFTDGHNNYNKLREKLGLPCVDISFHNLYINKNIFLNEINDFSIVKDRKLKVNFLSNHYLFSRVVLPLFIKDVENIRNSTIMKAIRIFPNIGMYSPLQLFILQKK